MPDGHIYSCPQLNKTGGQPDPPLLDQQKPGWTTWAWKRLRRLTSCMTCWWRSATTTPTATAKRTRSPYCVVGKDYPHRMFYDLLGSWGFGINGVMDSDYAFSWLDIDDAGKVRFIGREDKFKIWWNFTTSCGRRALVDKRSYSQDQTQAAAKVNAGRWALWPARRTPSGWAPPLRTMCSAPCWKAPYGDRALINVEKATCR